MIAAFKKWLTDTTATAATEMAMIFPVMMILMLGVVDLGYGILAAQKTIRASQVTADLITRHKSVTQSDIDEATTGGMLALAPFNTSTFGYDIISLRFDDNGYPEMPPLWRETSQNMEADNAFLQSLDGFGVPGEGIVVVRVQYEYRPVFSGTVIGDMTYEEIAFMAGRLSSTIPRQNNGSDVGS